MITFQKYTLGLQKFWVSKIYLFLFIYIYIFSKIDKK